MARKYLKMNMLIPAGVMVTDNPHRQPVSPAEEALDKWLRLLPDDCFTDTPPNMTRPQNPAELAAAKNLGKALQSRGPKEISGEELNKSVNQGRSRSNRFKFKEGMTVVLYGSHFKVIGVRPNGIAKLKPVFPKVKPIVPLNHVPQAPENDDHMREDCPVIAGSCDHYMYQCDSNGEVAICHCKHPDNPDGDHEGNCTHTLCPLTGPSGEDVS